METRLKLKDKNIEVLERVCDFIDFEIPYLHEIELNGSIKEICVAKLCNVIGITGAYNYKSDFLNFFSDIVAEAVVETLGYKFHIADEQLRFFSFDHVNLVSKARGFLENNDKDEAFIDVFNMVDDFKYLIPTLKKQ